MQLEKLIKNSIAEKDFHGLVVNYDEKVEIFWWKEGSEIINKFWAEIEITKPIMFSCSKGKLRMNL